MGKGYFLDPEGHFQILKGTFYIFTGLLKNTFHIIKDRIFTDTFDILKLGHFFQDPMS